MEVFDGLDAAFRAGAFVAVTGPSGSGKTTLLHLLAGLELPTAGEVEVEGNPMSSLERAARAEIRRRCVGLVTQRPGLLPFLSVRENVRLSRDIRALPELDPESLHALLAAVGLVERSEQRVSRLSAGEQVRTALARALAAEPSLLLVDEPTARLDREAAAAVGELLARLAREAGVAVVCATHDRAVVGAADEELALATTVEVKAIS
jgi:putative ABC transport system ATP-binding protein